MPTQTAVLDSPQRPKLEAINSRSLVGLYNKAHDLMRNIDGLQPQEAFDELLKFLFLKEIHEEHRRPLPWKRALADNGAFAAPAGPIAESLRKLFGQYVRAEASWLGVLWREAQFQLSDNCLVGLCELFRDVNLREVSLDIRSAALKAFMTPELRRGLGIYLTPDNVVRMMVDFVQPGAHARVYDPACGSGTFLIETLKFWRQVGKNGKVQIWGSDKSPRMLLLSSLNVGNLEGVEFHHSLMDALAPKPTDEWPKPNSFDVILTNPPFGVVVDDQAVDLNAYEILKDNGDGHKQRTASEVLFIEQSLRLLKPEGVLGIVLPKSVITNTALAKAREIIGRLGYLSSVALLPPETFHTAGAQTNTAVLFFRKYGQKEDPKGMTRVPLVEVTNVGYDSTGRSRLGDQVEQAAKDMREAIRKGSDIGLCRLLEPVRKEDSLKDLGGLMTKTTRQASNIRRRKATLLGDVCELITTGRTPARANYVASGLFLVKVGNLTGQGIYWMPRDRNFVPHEYAEKAILLRKHDIVLTSSAHSPKYIAKKVDIVGTMPKWVGGKASCVGEVMLVRTKPGAVDPFILLAYLRHPETMAQIQRMVRGQTAHLHPNDMKGLELPDDALRPGETLRELGEILREELRLADRLNVLAERQMVLSNAMRGVDG